MRALLLTLLASLFVTSSAVAFPDEQPGRLRTPLAREGRTVILQPARTLTDADRAELKQQGVFVKHALTGDRYLARVAAGRTISDPRIQSIEPMTAEHRIHSSAYSAVARGRSAFRAHVMFQRDVDFDAAREAVLAAGGAMDPMKVAFSPSQRIDVTLSPAALNALAGDDRVFAVAAARNWRVRSDNATNAKLSGVDLLHQAPYGLTGAGVTVSLFELAPAQQDHVEFGGRFTVNAVGGESSDSLHATHVAGTIAAGGLDPTAKGMAPAARIYQFCVAGPNDCENDWLEDKDQVLPSLGVVADNNSWGYVLGWSEDDFGVPLYLDAEVYYGAYELFTAAPIDEISIRRQILFIHSAGNDGSPQNFVDNDSSHRHVDEDGDTITDKMFCYSRNGSGTDCSASCNGGCETVRHTKDAPFDTIGVTAAAKNVLTVGNISGQTEKVIQISNSSSRGPAKDGRVKPDVVARGTNVRSTVPTNSYQSLGGTSMAAPTVTGIAALLTEQWRKTFSTSPSPAHLKAVILAGTVDLGNPGPDYTFGFGLVNAKNSADIILADGGRGSRIRTMGVSQSSTIETNAVVSETQNLRVLLHWPDPAIPFLGSDFIAAKALVNDLDLRVIDPSGTEHRAWVLNPAAPNENATRGTNTIDNAEMVEIPNAAPGVYRLIVNGKAVKEGPQTAVLVSSARTAAPCVDLQERTAGSNNSAETAFGSLVGGQLVNAGLCAASDVDFYKFTVTKSGPVSIQLTAGDTSLRATLTGGGVNTNIVIPANSTATLNANVATVPAAMILKVEADGTIGAEPQYSFVPEFGETAGPRRRATR